MTNNKIIHFNEDSCQEFTSEQDHYQHIYDEAYQTWLSEENDNIQEAEEYAALVTDMHKELDNVLSSGKVYISKHNQGE